MSYTFFCPCGFSVEDGDDLSALDHEPLDGGCCNCGGRQCMSCVFREVHDQCEWDCPDCSPKYAWLPVFKTPTGVR